MAEYGSIPAEFTGVPVIDLADVNFTGTRTVNQNATTGGIKNTFGLIKPTLSLTFKTLAARGAFLRQLGALQPIPTPGPFSFTLGGTDKYTLTECIASNVTAQSDQDGAASLVLQVSGEDLIDEGA